jgi:hypothetical protein
MKGRRFDALLLMVAGLCLAGVAYDLWPAAPTFAIEAEHVVDDALAGQESIVFFNIRNLTARPIKIVGAGFT